MTIKEIKNKISVIRNIGQITHALELVSAVKMKKSQRLALQSRYFSKKAVEILFRLAKYHNRLKEKSVFLKETKGRKTLALIIASDKGFCGAFNKNILNFSDKNLKNEKNLEILAVGKKTAKFLKKKKYNVIQEFLKVGDSVELSAIKPVSKAILKAFLTGDYQKILLFYTDFISSFKQEPKVVKILPLDLNTIGEIIANYNLKPGLSEGPEFSKDDLEYIIEPSPEQIFEELVPQLIEFEMFHCLLEANASEHSARMLAMKSASSNAKDLILKLTMEYNKARQAQITSELAEITTAKESLQS